MTVIIVSTNRRDKAHDERLPYDCRVVAAVPVGGVREGEQEVEGRGLESVCVSSCVGSWGGGDRFVYDEGEILAHEG